jgi:hypothetical protein
MTVVLSNLVIARELKVSWLVNGNIVQLICERYLLNKSSG